MIPEANIDKAIERLIERSQATNEVFLQKIGETVKEIGTLTPSEARQLQQMVKYGDGFDEITEEIARLTEKNVEDIYEIYDAVAQNDYQFAKQFYDYRGINQIPYTENYALQNQVNSLAMIMVSNYASYANANSLGYGMIDSVTGEVTYKGMQDTYYGLVDEAIFSVAQGKESFDAAMYRQLKTIGEGGLRVIYPSTYETTNENGEVITKNRSMRLDSAIRMNMKQGLTELHNETQNIFGQEFGADGVEISVHSNPAPDHAPYQGKQFSKKEYEELQASLGRPIGMYNCYHYNFAIVLGVSKPEYSQEELDRINEENEEGFEYEGKHYTNYEGTQRQRQLERAVREQKDNQILGKASGNKQLIAESQENITKLTDEYKKFSEASGLPTKMKRMRVVDYQRTKVNNITSNEPKGFENSKIRDDNGNLMKVYHGTNAEFDTFDKSKYNTNEKAGDYVGEGFYFTKNESTANKYGKNVKKAYLNIENPLIINSEEEAKAYRESFDGLYNPIKQEDINLRNEMRKYSKDFDYFELMKTNPSLIREEVQKRGYDGLIDNLYNQFAVFEPEQIKIIKNKKIKKS